MIVSDLSIFLYKKGILNLIKTTSNLLWFVGLFAEILDQTWNRTTVFHRELTNYEYAHLCTICYH